jgi:hypothetical protein
LRGLEYKYLNHCTRVERVDTRVERVDTSGMLDGRPDIFAAKAVNVPGLSTRGSAELRLDLYTELRLH